MADLAAIHDACAQLRRETSGYFDTYATGSGSRRGLARRYPAPLAGAPLGLVLDVSDAAVATSGTYRRGLHVVDPFTGRHPRSPRSPQPITLGFAAAAQWLQARIEPWQGPRGKGSLRG